MKLNLDAEPEDLGVALQAAFTVMQAEPNLEVGESIYIQINDVDFRFTRNEDSFTSEAIYE
jgi:hypothetical protein